MLDEFRKLGYSVARGVPQAATGFVDLAALPLTLSGMIKPEDVFGSTDYLTKLGLLPKPEQGLLPETTELVSSLLSPAGATKAAIVGTGGLLGDAILTSGALERLGPPVGAVSNPINLFHGTNTQFDEFNTPTAWFTDNKTLLEQPDGYDGIGKPQYIMQKTIEENDLKLLDLSKKSDLDLHENKFTEQLIDMGYEGVKYPKDVYFKNENVYQIFKNGLRKLKNPKKQK